MKIGRLSVGDLAVVALLSAVYFTGLTLALVAQHRAPALPAAIHAIDSGKRAG